METGIGAVGDPLPRNVRAAQPDGYVDYLIVVGARTPASALPSAWGAAGNAQFIPRTGQHTMRVGDPWLPAPNRKSMHGCNVPRHSVGADRIANLHANTVASAK